MLVREGTYGSFTVDGKSLQVVGEEGADVLVQGGHVFVEGLSTTQGVLLSSMNMTGRLTLRDCQGQVRLESLDIEIPGPGYSTPNSWSCDPYPTLALIQNCSDVVITHCNLVGREADYEFNADGGPGESALVVESSSLRLFGSSLRGGEGGYADGHPFGCPWLGGHGGSALVLFQNSIAWLDDTTLQGGIGGQNGCGWRACHGEDAWLDINSQMATQEDHIPLSLHLSPTLHDGDSLSVTIDGEPSAPVVMILGTPYYHRSLPIGIGTLLTGPPFGFHPLGALDGSGSLTTSMNLPPLMSGAAFETYSMQTMALLPEGRHLSNAATITVLPQGI